MKVKIKKLHPDAVIPKYATVGSSGFDLVAVEDVVIHLYQTKIVKTGLIVAIPEGFELQVRPRSGTSFKTGLRIANSPGTVDADYRGEIGIVIHLTPYDHQLQYAIKKGDRIAQGVICPIIKAEFEEVENLDETERGSNGFGSSGK